MRQERRASCPSASELLPAPPCTQRAAGPRGARLRLPGSPWAPRSGVASRVRRLLPGYVLSLIRQTFSGGLYVQARAAAVDRNMERPARGEKEGRAPSNAGARQVAPPRRGHGPCRRDGPPVSVASMRGAGTRRAGGTGAQPSAPSRAHAASAPPASLQTHRRQRTARHAERPARLARGFPTGETGAPAAGRAWGVSGQGASRSLAPCRMCRTPPSPRGLAVGVRALPPASYGPERARQRLSLFPAPLPVNEVTRRPWVVTPG